MRVSTWHQALSQCEQQGCGYVLITLIASAGSVPRDAGTKMVVTHDTQYDTIGGGHLEFLVVNTARELLLTGTACQKVVSMPLSSKLGQCCGGAVKVLYEVMVCHQQHLAIFGAGHVAQALVPILAQLPLQIRWVDSREEFFADPLPSNCYPGAAPNKTAPNTTAHNIMAQSANAASASNTSNAAQIASAYENVTAEVNDDPTEALCHLPNHSWVVILTHNHQLDYTLVETALQHPKLDFIGMIGSTTKAKRFVTRLAHRGYSDKQIKKMISPIGDLHVTGKRPIEVAVSISAQLIGLLNPRKPSDTTNHETVNISGEA